MENKEIIKIRKEIISEVIKTLLMSGQNIEITDSNITPFVWDGRKCAIYTHKTFNQSGQSFMPVEYSVDDHSDFVYDFDDMIFVDYFNKNYIYRIPKINMYNSINNGVSKKRSLYRVPQFDVLKNRGLCVNIELGEFKRLDGMSIYNLDNLRQNVPSTYNPLVNKIVKQFFEKGTTSWDQLLSMAYEGLALAMNNYDPWRSDMNFTQYAAFSIRNNILTSLDNELRVVKLSNYAQKKAIEYGESLWNSVSIDALTSKNDDDHTVNKENILNIYENAKFDDGDVFEYLYMRLESNFPQRECLMFYKTFGLKGYEELKGKDISKELGVSEALVSQKISKIKSWIRKDRDICEMLQNLM